MYWMPLRLLNCILVWKETVLNVSLEFDIVLFLLLVFLNKICSIIDLIIFHSIIIIFLATIIYDLIMLYILLHLVESDIGIYLRTKAFILSNTAYWANTATFPNFDWSIRVPYFFIVDWHFIIITIAV